MNKAISNLLNIQLTSALAASKGGDDQKELLEIVALAKSTIDELLANLPLVDAQ
jgi:predicted transcriptional regulator